MKYCILIMDGASGWPLPKHGGKTCLELADSPNLDAMAQEALVGLVGTIPPGMEPGSACACMSVLGYNPAVYYRGRSAIEAKGMDIPIGEGEVVFRCNLVSVRDGKMLSYSAGYISTEEAKALIASLNKNLGSDTLHFYPGVSYRHICKIKGHEDTLSATCTPPHDIPGKPIKEFFPRGPGSNLLKDLMARSEVILQDHPVNIARRTRGDIPTTMIWLFWGSGKVPNVPPFKDIYGLNAALTSGVDILRGLARMTGMEILNILGVTDGLDNNYAAQATGALEAFKKHDLVVIHVEAPDEAAHAGSVEGKIEAIEKVDKEIVSQVRSWNKDTLRVLLLPDHSTPISVQTHVGEPVPFMLWGQGFKANGAHRFTEAEAKSTGILIEEGYKIMGRLIE
ncbi:MAG: cofactor-independent phosphoglycerate mutase [Chloroflexi bacterium CG_4_8_14_3_um_filter_45_15]|nr:MAG: cofactor-independent phosphoglycerate mutase [Chloroflexi bacterium CG_4_8_14_3_um_filter_45_15]